MQQSLAAAVDAALLASRAMVAIAARSIPDTTPITLNQLRALVEIADAPMSIAALAARLRVAPSSASRMCDRLERHGLVQREEDPASRRAILVRATAEGRRLVRTVLQRRRREMQHILRGLSEDELGNLVRALHVFAQAATDDDTAPAWAKGWQSDPGRP